MANYKTIYLALICIVSCAHAQFSPQYIGTKNSIINQLNKNALDGSEVRIYHAIEGDKHPPDYSGSPDADNILISRSAIGHGVDPAILNSGRFSATAIKNVGTYFFVRVFDRGFYSDSEVYEITSKSIPITVEFKDSMSPVDDRDFDGDGLHNSWEETYGTDVNVTDSDSDGFNDYSEICFGTDPTNSNDFLTIYGIEIIDGETILTWDAREGVEYIVEKSTNWLYNIVEWESISTNFFGFVVITNTEPYILLRINVNCE